MISKTYSPLNIDGMEYDRFGRIVVIDRKAFIQSLAEKIEGIDVNSLIYDASDRDEMKKIVEEAIKLNNQTEIME